MNALLSTFNAFINTELLLRFVTSALYSYSSSCDNPEQRAAGGNARQEYARLGQQEQHLLADHSHALIAGGHRRHVASLPPCALLPHQSRLLIGHQRRLRECWTHYQEE